MKAETDYSIYSIKDTFNRLVIGNLGTMVCPPHILKPKVISESTAVRCSGNNSEMHNLRNFQSQCWHWRSAVFCSVQWLCTCIFGLNFVLWWCCPRESLVRRFYLSLETHWSLVSKPKVSCIHYYVLLQVQKFGISLQGVQ